MYKTKVIAIKDLRNLRNQPKNTANQRLKVAQVVKVFQKIEHIALKPIKLIKNI